MLLVDEKAFKAKEAEANQLLSNSKFKEASVIYKEMLQDGSEGSCGLG